MIRDIRTVVRPHAVSDYTEGKIDLIDDAMNWLIHFKLQNEELLKQLSIKVTSIQMKVLIMQTTMQKQ